jgi:hypothetical protein
MTDSNKEVSLYQQPENIVQFGQKSASSLLGIVKKGNWSVKVNGHEFLKFEAWQTLGRFFGYTVKTESTEYVTLGQVQGFNSKVVVLDNSGLVVGGAEAMCLNDEPNWKNKPLFQLKSMAQTRACAKAYRQILAWVVVLAGFEGTPAEEMDGSKTENNNGGSKAASMAQIRKIYALGNNLGLDSEKTEGVIKTKYGVDSIKNLTIKQAFECIDKMQEKVDEKMNINVDEIPDEL